MRRKPPINEFSKRPPNAVEVKKAIAMAKRVSRKLAAMMEARTRNEQT